MIAAVLAVLAQLTNLVTREAGAALRWVRQEALRVARAARALAIWIVAEATAWQVLAAAALIAFEAITVYLSRYVITPLAETFINHCIPAGSAGDGLIWLLWDSGLNGRVLFTSFVTYMVNYTAIWAYLDRFLRAQAIALSVYRSTLRRNRAIRESAVP